MPMLGLGTDGITDPTIISRAILEIGYRTIDTASRYKNEEVIGQAVRLAIEDPRVARDNLFVITKVWIEDIEDVEAACRLSLKKLGLDYVDLYLMHYPIAVRTLPLTDNKGGPQYEIIKMPIHKIWPQLEALVKLGLARSIGVSNFNVQSLWDLLTYCEIPPAVNEVEINPLINQEGLVKYCLANHILPVAYSALARASNTIKKKGTANVLEFDLIQMLASKYQRAPTQVVLNWGLIGRGYSVIPKSATFERQRDNFHGVYDFKMDEAEYKRITDELYDGSKICSKNDWAFFHDIFA